MVERKEREFKIDVSCPLNCHFPENNTFEVVRQSVKGVDTQNFDRNS